MFDSLKIWGKENKEKKWKQKKNKKIKIKNRFKINKLFLYVCSNPFYLISFIV